MDTITALKTSAKIERLEPGEWTTLDDSFEVRRKCDGYTLRTCNGYELEQHGTAAAAVLGWINRTKPRRSIMSHRAANQGGLHY